MPLTQQAQVLPQETGDKDQRRVDLACRLYTVRHHELSKCHQARCRLCCPPSHYENSLTFIAEFLGELKHTES